MPDKYHNKYRIPSARVQSWDYARRDAMHGVSTGSYTSNAQPQQKRMNNNAR